MTRSIAFLLLFLLVASTAISGPETITIRAVEARLYLHYSGKLSDPISPDASLWNTVIGEGAAREPSTETLVDVIVAGTPGEYRTTWKIELEVKGGTSGKVISKQVAEVGVLGDAGEFHVPFWLRDTGCERLLVRARVKGTRVWKEIVVPFACGE